MQLYSVQISADKWPTTYQVEATSWNTAVARAIREWKKKDGKGSRTQQLNIKAFKTQNLKSDDGQ